MGKRKAGPTLGHRERQILDAVYRLGEASVGEVLDALPNPPGYSSVRKMLSLLEKKGLVRHRRYGVKYAYRPVEPRDSAARTAVKHLLATFFSGSPADAVNTILDVSSERLTDEDIARLQAIVEQARREVR
jgi:BlaI family transcriptional regulator, penicillinase repressor